MLPAGRLRRSRSRQTIGRVMGDSKDKPPDPPDTKRSGRAGVDDRGNTVWEWQLETGVYSRDITTQRLKKLDLGELSIAETASHQRPAGLGPKDKPKSPGGGFNPYDSAGGSDDGGGGNPYDNARNASKKLQQPGNAPAPRKPMDLKRLEEWMQIRKRLEQQKKDDDED
jgi:hypothetical protein